MIDYTKGEWNYGSVLPYDNDTMVGPEGNPNRSVDGSFANPTCNSAELSYLIDGAPVPGGCYSLDRSVSLEVGQTLQILNNDRSDGYRDNEGEMFITNICNF